MNQFIKQEKRMRNMKVEEVAECYRIQGEYYTDIVSNMSDKIFNWAFTLNTGGLLATITFMGAVIKQKDRADSFFIILIILFGLGIFAILISVFLERRRFERKGKLLDNNCEKFKRGKLNSEEFISRIYETPEGLNNLTLCVNFLTAISYILFSLGVIISICSIK